MLQPGRKFNSQSGYRYGFNGQEKDNDVKGDGNSYTAQYWEYDGRIGRRWDTDPKQKIWESPYLVFSGNPIWFSDVNGDTPGDTTKKTLMTTSISMNMKLMRMQALQDYYEASRIAAEKNKINEKNALPLISFTAVLTKGSFGTKSKALGVGYEYTAMDNETDMWGIRDNKNVNNREKEYTSGMSVSLGVAVPVPLLPIPIGVGAGKSLKIITKEPLQNGKMPSTAVIEKKTSASIVASVSQKTAQGKFVYSGTKVEIFGFKSGFYYGYELSLELNFKTHFMAAPPYFIQDNPADNTATKPKIIPILKH